ncbi:activator of basal transcription 1-like [Periplaneta americana]|uniref:activator of basal transcription 1-like n=1 Tax=Periplaneta americana TaxID=6978 RepID=UPI0037E83499
MDMDVNDVSHKRKRKYGIIYLSTLPRHMNVTKIREIFGLYGDVGRVFLQPAESGQKENKKKKRKLAKHFTEGWVEFKSKRIAKEVALQLNNSRISERKKSKFYDHLWNIKYLPRFNWVHLNERLAYERAVHQQRLRTEIAQAKREANFIAHNMERSEKFKSKKLVDSKVESRFGGFTTQYRQRKTDKDIENETKNTDNDRISFLKDLFGGDS